MSILDGIKDKAMALMGKASSLANRGTQVYDASKNSITVCGVTLDGVVNSSISDQQVTQQEQGFDKSYYAFYDVVTPQTLSVSILPTAKSIEVLSWIYQTQLKKKGWLEIIIYENGKLLEVYRGHLIALPEINMSMEANDRTYTFGVTTIRTRAYYDQSLSQEDSLENYVDNTVSVQGGMDNLPVPENGIIT